VDKPKAQLPDADPFAHLTAAERFAQAVERRDTLIREHRTPKQRGRGTPLAGSRTVTAARSAHNAPQK
jgi:hypothetical protein